MGLFDNILGKKDKDEAIVLEPVSGGYVIKGQHARSSRFNKAHVFFNLATPLKDEQDRVKELIKEFNLEGDLEPGAIITASYETIPDIDEYIAQNEMPESLNAFLMARAMLNGLARGQAEMTRLTVNHFNIKGIKGILILKES